ncbi:cell division protein FtsH [Candidatus Roizmanbacteria bacterium RIFCSPLOWO2_02_FULL_37_19]|nr:MAG: cell division protein FtsH [Candidatus Roizmanbacteria bacterium RIFCSPHIGHO2_01_FULL_38_41]OGK31906.1 MAG: cell division protein FtsH [Candidatus Roizmanbacteria bacterium RIFCSPHIGHO2_12_FULL_37_23]OGK54006.1 MAG: cell division protein FtsH [Candidatus Roizmanbacteria bacterium RIFCSPLOWO2_02_FULL_37_19]OGK61851.1 MAG: cell division protein FtsH [Candidatus Roizmanbacteria bacterium RIFCSPLOWO2_12_FULL_37_7b]
MRTLFIIVFVILFGLTIFYGNQEFQRLSSEKPINEVLTAIKTGKIEKIERSGNTITAIYKNGERVSTKKEAEDSFRQILQESGIDPDDINVLVRTNEETSLLSTFIINVIPTILIIAFFIFIFRQARGAQDSIFSFGQSRSKRFSKKMSKITFKDVAGVDEAKKELEEIVDFLKNPKKYKKLGARPPKGVILVGPAGTGKTLLAKAVAGESNVPFFSVAGSEFMEMLVGIGAARVRDLFSIAKTSAPSIIFIDEIDAIGRTRSVSAMPAHDEREQTLNQILVEMDGFTPNDQVIVVAATNRGDLLDSALLRPGRFDRRVIIDYPDLEGRKSILKIHAQGKPLAKNVSWEKLARRTVGFSGADIENMLNEAAILAAREQKESVSMDDLEEAATKVKLGPEKKRLQTDLDKKITAYHEGGHGIVTHFQSDTDPVHRISIVSRGMSLGHTLIPPRIDRLHQTKTRLLKMITSMLGGRAAEELIFEEVTTGAANDFDQATNIARSMVIEYGMSDLGPINYGPTQDITEWGRAFYEQSYLSQETMNKIDSEVNKIISACYKNAVIILKKHKRELEKVAEVLIKKESLDGDEFAKLVGKKPSA